jgi:AcrR family transcriptional regulator
VTRKDAEREARQRFIVEATRRLLAERDLDDVTMDDIAKAAEYSRRTLYRYFQSRDEIMLLILVEDLRARWVEQQAALAKTPGGLAKIQTWATVLFDFSQRSPQSLKLQVYWDYRGIDRAKMPAEIFADFEALNNELADGLRDIFRLGVEDGSLRPDIEIDLCISQFLYTLRVVIHRALSPTYTFAAFAPDEYVRHYIALFSEAICRRKEQVHV